MIHETKLLATSVDGNRQKILSIENLSALPDASLSIPLFYNTSTADNTLTGISLRLHYNSNELRFQTVENLFNNNLFVTLEDLADSNDFDKNPGTDRYIQFGYLDFLGNWPNQLLPLKLGDFNFTTTENFKGTQLKVTAIELATNYTLESEPIIVNLVDTIAPTVSITSIGAGDSTVSGVAADNTVVGTAEAGSGNVTIRLGNTELGTTAVDENGNFTYSLTEDNLTTIGQGTGKTITASQTDPAGNIGTSTPFTFGVDTIAPTVTITDNISNTASGDILYTFTFSEAVTGFTTEDITVTNGSKGTFTPVSPTQYTLVVTPNANFEGNLTVAVPGGAAIDSAGNPSLAPEVSVQAVDTKAPTVTITDNISNTASGDILYTFTFSEPVTEFTAGDITVTNGSKGTFTPVSPTQYTLVVTPNANFEGNLTVAVPGGAAIDSAGNPSLAPEVSVQAVDTKAPTVAITDNISNIASGDILYTFTFSEPVTEFTAGDITVTNGSKGTFTPVSPTQYTLVVTPNANFEGNLTVAVPGGAAIDSAIIPSIPQLSIQPVDTKAPTVSITDNASNIASGDILYTFTFSEPVTDFTAGDITVTNGSKGTFTAVSPTQYTLVVTPNANFEGNLTVAVPGGAAIDSAGNPSLAPEVSVQAVDTIAPTVSINIIGGADLIVSGVAADNTVVGTAEPGSGNVTIRLGNTELGTTAVDENGNFTYSLTEDNLTTIGQGTGKTITASQTDPAGNIGTSTPFTFGVDTIAPTVTITDNISNTASGDILYTFTFSEPVTEFTAGDITVTNGSKGTFTPVSPTQYTLVVTPNANFEGNLTVAVPGGAAIDSAGNPSLAPEVSVQAVDTIAPTVSITDNASNIASGDILYTFTFSEPVTDFTAGDITVTNGSKGTFTAVSPTQYTLVVTPNANFEGNLTVAVPGGAAIDSAGNPSLAPEVSVQALDTIAPTVSINIIGGADLIVSGVAADNTVVGTAEPGSGNITIRLGNTELGTTAVDENGNFTYSLTEDNLTTIGQGTGKTITASQTDPAGNIGTSTPFTFGVDTIAPTVTITDNISNTASGDILYTFTFSEPVTEFTAGDITVTNGSKGTFTPVSPTQYTLVVTPNANFEGNLTVAVPGGAAIDSAGNPSLAPEVSVQAVDTIAPTVSITDNASNIASGDILYTFTFSEPVTEFTAGDITVTNGSKGTFTAVSPTQYTLVVTPNANFEGNLTVAVPGGAAIDSAGNPSLAPEVSVQAVDTIAPTVSINIIGGADLIVSGVAADNTVVGTAEPGSGNITIRLGNTELGTTAVDENGNFTYSLTEDNLTTIGQGTGKTITASQTDPAGNIGTSTPFTFGVDTIAPTVTITDNISNTASGDILYTFTFSEPVTEFTDGDITVTNGSKGTFTAVSPTQYTLVVTPNANFEGNLTVAVPGGAAIDSAGNPSLAPEVSVQAVDTIAPTVSINIIGGADLIVSGVAADNTVVGTAQPGSGNITIRLGNTELGTTAVDENGNFTYNLTEDNLTTIGQGTGKTITASQTDSAGNIGTSTSFTFGVDTIAPTVSITDNASNIATDSILYTFTFSEAVTGFSTEDITVTNGSKGTFTPVSPTQYTLVVTPNANFEGNLTVAVLGGAAIDTPGNLSLTPEVSVQALDTIAPTVSINIIGGADLIVSGVAADNTVVGTAEPGSGNITIRLGNTELGTTAVDENGNFTYSLTEDNLTTIGQGTGKTITASQTDPVGNIGTSTSFTFGVDTIAPTVAITSIGGVDNRVSGVAADNTVVGTAEPGSGNVTIRFGNIALGTTAVDENGNFTYSLTEDNLTTIGQGTGKTITASQTDSAGNIGTSTSFTFGVDTIAPTVTITDNISNIATGSILYTFTFSEPVTEFTAGDITVTNGSKGTFTPVSPTQYTLVVTPNANFEGNLTVAVPGGAAIDSAIIPSIPQLSIQPVDTKAPTVSITDNASNIASGDILYTFTFSEPVTDFTAGDITVTNGSKGTFTAVSPTQYTLVVTPNANFEGNLTVVVPGGAAIDSAGNPSLAPEVSVQAVDTIAPTVSINIIGGADLIVSGVAADNTVVGTAEPGSGNITIRLGNTELGTTAVDENGNFTYSLTEDNLTTIGQGTGKTITASQTDPVGNIGTSTSFTFGVDTIAPTVAITSIGGVDNRVSGVAADNTVVGTAEPGSGNVTIRFGNTELGTTAVNENGNFTYSLTEDNLTTIGQGTGKTITASQTDPAGNIGTSTPFTFGVDTIAPTVTITDNISNTASGDILYTFTFSEPVTEFTDGDITVTNGSKGTFTPVSPTQYTLVVTPNPNFEGDLTVAVPGGAAIDSAGNPSLAPQASVQAVDTKAPTVTITDNISNTASGDILYTFTFSEPVTEFTAGDITVTNGSKGTFTPVSPTQYTLVVTANPNFEGNLTVAVPGGAAIDSAGNPSLAPEVSVQAVDTKAPTVTITDNISNTASGDILYTFTFSEPVTEFTAGDITVTNGSKGTFTPVSPTQYTLVVTPNANFEGNLTVVVPGGAAIDSAGNPSLAPEVSVQAVDTIAPTVSINIIGGADLIVSGVAADNTVVGTAEPGSGNITIRLGNTELGTTAVDENGNFTYSLTEDNLTTIGQGTGKTITASQTDPVGNIGTSTSFTFGVDTIAPTVAITSIGGVDNRVSGVAADNTVVGTAEPGSGNVTIRFGNTELGTTAVNENGNFTYSLTEDNLTTIGQGTGKTITASQTDPAGNIGTSTPFTFGVDTIAPTVTITDNISNTASGDILYTFTFSEPVTEFTDGDITVTNGSKGTFTPVSPTQYTLVVTPNPNFEGDLTVAVPGGAAIDSAGNPSLAPQASVQAVDTKAPTVTITDNISNTASGDILYTFTFSEPVTEFTAGDITVTNGSKGTFTPVSPTQYTLVVTPNANFEGNLTVAVPGGAAIDSAGNPSLAPEVSVQAVDTKAPTVTITDNISNTASGDILYTFTFSEPVTEFTAGDITVTNGSKGTFTPVSPTQYTLVVTPNANFEGNLTVAVPGGAAIDSAGNPSLAPEVSVQAVDTIAPTVSINIIGGADLIVSGVAADNTVVGTAEPGSGNITIRLGNTELGTTAVDENGNFTYSLTEDNLTTIGQGTGKTITASQTDPVGNIGTSTSFTFGVDTIAPTVAITSIGGVDNRVSGVAADNTVVGTAEPGSGNVTIRFGNTELGTTAVNENGNFTYSLTEDNLTTIGQGTGKTITASQTDPAGNIGTSTPFTFGVDTIAPTVTITDNISNTASGDILYTFTFSEPVTEFTDGDITVTNGSKGTFTPVSPTQYTLVVTPNPNFEGDLTVAVPGGAAIDSAGNPSLAPQASVQAVDTKAPTVTITDNISNTASGDILYTFTFSEPVTEFTAGDITVTNGSKGTFTPVSPTQYTLVVTANPNFEGNLTVAVPGGAAIDSAGNPSLAPEVSVQAVDTKAPTVTITDNISNTASGDILYTFTFSEPVTEFTAGDITVTNGSKGTFTPVSPTQYTLVVTPNANFEGNLTVAVPGGAAIDSAGNPSLAPEVSVQAVDTIAPEKTGVATDGYISGAEVTRLNGTGGSVTTDTNGRFSFTALGGTGIIRVRGGVDVSTGQPFTGELRAPANAGVITPVTTLVVALLGDNAETATAAEIQAATVQVRDILNLPASIDLLNDDPIEIIRGGGLLAADALQFQRANVQLGSILQAATGTEAGFIGGAQVLAQQTQDGQSIDLTSADFIAEFLNNAQQAGVTLSQAAQDTANFTQSVSQSNSAIATVDNLNAIAQTQATLLTETIGLDEFNPTPVPTLTITSEPAVDTPPTGDPNYQFQVRYTFTFSEPVTGFTADDIKVTNGTKEIFTTVSATEYTLVVGTNVVNRDAPGETGLGVAVGAGAAIGNNSGNPSVPASLPAPVAPVINLAAADDRVNRQEQVDGFNITGTGTPGAEIILRFDSEPNSQRPRKQTTVQPNGTWSTPITADDVQGFDEGEEGIFVYQKLNGNVSPQRSRFINVDTVLPTVSITDNASNIATDSILYTFTFSEAVTGFTTEDITVTNGSKGTFTPVSPTQYTLVVTPNPNFEGNLTVAVPGGAAIDSAGNPSLAPQASVQAVDTKAPTVTITDNISNTASGDILYTFTFSEPVTEFTAGDITVTNGSKGTFTPVSPTQYTLVVTPNPNFEGNLTVAVPGGAAIDSAGNPSLAPQASVQAVDTKAPTVTITDNISNTASGDILYTFTFSEPVTEFTAGDITVTNGSKGTFTPVSPTQYTLVVTPNPNFEGNLTVVVPGGAAIDSAGNPSLAPEVSVQAVDTIAPTVSINIIGGADLIVSGVAADNTVVGTAEPGSGNVTIRFGNIALGTTAVDENGNFTYSLTEDNLTTIGQGTGKTITASQTDSAGNIGISTSFTFGVDTIAPTVAITSIGGVDNRVSGVAADNTVVGTAEPGSGNVTIRFGNTELGTTAVNENGNFTYSLTEDNLTTIGQGTGKTITASQTDPVGNIGTSTPFTFGVDTIAPTVIIRDPNTRTPVLQQPFDTVFRFSITGSTPSSQELQVVFGDGTTQSILTTLGNASGLPSGIDSILNNLQSGLLSISQENGNVTTFRLRQVGTRNITPLTIGQVTANGFTLTGGGFNITAEVLGSPDTVIISTQKIEVNGDELEAISLNNLDTSNVTGERITVQVDATLYREAAFDNLVGFYLAERTTGAVVDRLTGQSIGLGDRSAYLDAVRNNAVLTGSGVNNETRDLSSTFEVGSSLDLSNYVLLPFLVANGDLNSVASDFSNLYVASMRTNFDRSDHVQLLGNNVFGFEDIADGGDNDFDDVIIQVRGLSLG